MSLAARWTLRCAVVAGILAAPALEPAAASAHAGHTDPVATSFLAKVDAVPPGIAVRVVDGDQRLWMSVNPVLSVIVVGRFGEPYLRFNQAGVDENIRSPTTYLNRATPIAAPKGTDATAPPSWKHMTDSHSYMWHEDRLHTLALSSPNAAAGDVGPWTVPLTINGAKHVISGQLWRAADPSLLWFWPTVVCLVCLAALIRARDQRIIQRLGALLALLTVAAVAAGRIGRELYGHPDVSAWQRVDLALTVVLALLALVAFVRSNVRPFTSFMVGAFGLYQGLVLLPTLTHGYVMAAMPAPVERSAASVSLACGIGAMLCFVLAVAPQQRVNPRHLAARKRAPREQPTH